MTNLFQTILQMSAAGSIVILCVYIARLCLKAAPKIFSYALWALVLFRLLCPVTITSPVSVIPKQLVQDEFTILHDMAPDRTAADTEQSGDILPNNTILEDAVIPSDSASSPTIPNQAVDHLPDITTPIPESAISPHEENPLTLWAYFWLLGFLGMTGYSIFSLLWIYRKVQVCIHIKDNIYMAEDIDTPFTLGFVRPKIYLPTGLSEREMDYIVAHEKHHIKRLDPIIKLVAFFALCVHWFNPLAWLAFLLAGKDMEMSCDEAVMRTFPEDIRKEYSSSLLRLASGKRRISMIPLAFGENNIKARIVNVLNYQKPVFWVMTVAALLCAALALVLLTNPDENPSDDEMTSASTATETTAEVTSETLPDELKMRDFTVNRMFADLTGDGVQDMIRLSINLPESTSDFIPARFAEFLGQNWATVSVYKGIELEKYEEEPIWVYDGITDVHSGNGQLSLVHEHYTPVGGGGWHNTYNPNTPYLMRSSLYTSHGMSSYYYEVFSLTEDGEEVIVDSYATGDFSSEEYGYNPPTIPTASMVLPEFYKHLSKWDTGMLIIAADADLSDAEVQNVMYSLSESNYAGTASYNPIWHMDYYTRALGTQFTTKYFKCEFPGEWAGQLFYRETHDGMVVEIYHAKSIELGLATESGMKTDLIGKLFLVPVGQTAADMTHYFLTQNEIAHARYIGETIDGKYMPMACPSEKVISPAEPFTFTIDDWFSQAATEAYEEFFQIGAHFTDMRIAGYASGRYSTSVPAGVNFYGRDFAKYPDYGFGDRLIAAPGQPLTLEEPDGRTVLFHVNRKPEERSVSLTIDNTDYSNIFYEIPSINPPDYALWYTAIDLDPTDRSTEIMIYYSGDSMEYHVYVFSLEGDNLSYMGCTGAPIFHNAVTPHGDGTFTVWEHRQYIENNAIPVTYSIVNGTLEKAAVTEYAFLELRYHDVVKDLEVYTQQDTASEKVTLKAGETSVCITKVFTPDGEINYKDFYFYEIITDTGETYYIYHSRENWLHEHLDNLHLAA